MDSTTNSGQATASGAPALWPLYVLFTASGVTALVYEVMWMRGFSLVFGSTTRAASIVLAAFFLGLAIGNFLAGRWTRDRTRALLLYGLMELVIAVGAVGVVLWLDLYRAQYPALYRSSLGGTGSLTLLQLGLAIVAMAPPCIAMGATLPLMSRAIVTATSRMGRRVSTIYALNTYGATAGVLLSGFFLPVWFGTRNTIYLAALVNVAIAGVAILVWWHWRRQPMVLVAEAGATDVATGAHLDGADLVPARGARPEPDASGAQRPPAPSRRDRMLLVVAAASGFGTLALEVLYTRLIANALDASVYSFAVMLAVFLVALAIGSTFVSLIVDRLRTPWSLIAWSAALGAIAIAVSPWAFEWVWRTFPPPPRGSGWGQLRWEVGFAALITGPGIILIGMVLPAIWKTATRHVEEVGGRIGWLTGVNTIAGVLGSLVAGFVILPFVGVGPGIAAAAVLYAALAVVGITRSWSGRRRAVFSVAIATAVAGLFVFQPWRVRPLRLTPNERLIQYFESDAGTVAVTEMDGSRLLRYNSRFTLGASAGEEIHRSQGLLGLALHGQPRVVAFIGVATGMSLSAIKEYDSVERAVAMEIVPGVVQAAYAFEDVNLEVLRDPRVEVLVADGRNHLFGTSETFDVIVGDLFFPWQAGTGYLFTAEHFAIVKERLNPGGVFVQWLQANQLSVEELRIIVGTFGDVFDDAQLWLNTIQRGRLMIGLVGRESGGTSTSADPPLPDTVVAGSLHLCDGSVLRDWSFSAARNTDDYPILEFSAAASHLHHSTSESQKMGRTLRTLTNKGRSGLPGSR